MQIAARQQQAFGGDGYTDCGLCYRKHVGVPVARMRELLIGGRVLETHLHTPLLVCPECAAKWGGSSDLAGLAVALVSAEQAKRASVREYLEATGDTRTAPPLPDESAARWMDEILTGAFHPICLLGGQWQGRDGKNYPNKASAMEAPHAP